MTLTTDILIYLAAGGAIGALVTYALMVANARELKTRLTLQEQSKDHMMETFKALSSDALQSNNQQFLTLATENLQRFQQQADSQLQQKQNAIAQMLQPVTESLQKMDGKIAEIEQKREGAYSELKTLVNTMKDQHILLQSQTSSLVQTLRAPTSRGHWGETQLKTVLDYSNLVEGVHYSRQVSTEGMRPDIVVQLPPDKVLLIDAKVPLHNYQHAMQQDATDEEKNVFLVKHANDLRSHIKKLSDKDYSSGFNSFDWVVMFLPLEGLIQMALDKQPDLIEYAWSKNIILATPTNLLALMRTVSYAHDQFKVNENAREISKLGETLYKRITVFAEHMSKVGRSLGGALDSYNEAVGSLERNVLPSLRRMKETGITKSETREVVLTPLEELPRKLTAPELIDVEERL